VRLRVCVRVCVLSIGPHLLEGGKRGDSDLQLPFPSFPQLFPAMEVTKAIERQLAVLGEAEEASPVGVRGRNYLPLA
jgi:hypothetical protein